MIVTRTFGNLNVVNQSLLLNFGFKELNFFLKKQPTSPTQKKNHNKTTLTVTWVSHNIHLLVREAQVGKDNFKSIMYFYYITSKETAHELRVIKLIIVKSPFHDWMIVYTDWLFFVAE